MQTTLTYRTNRDLFSNHYLDEHLPETEAWNEVDDEALREAYDEIAGFRDNATKTNSLVDRLKGITLPDPDDVAADLDRYVETRDRADELDDRIARTDRLIDEIVYELYGLTDEEIEIVENAVEA